MTRDFTAVDFRQRRAPANHEPDVDALKEKINSRAPDLVYGQALNFLDYFASLGGF